MNWSLVMTALGIMVKGVLSIFVVILVIWGMVALLNYLTNEK